MAPTGGGDELAVEADAAGGAIATAAIPPNPVEIAGLPALYVGFAAFVWMFATILFWKVVVAAELPGATAVVTEATGTEAGASTL